MSVIPRSQTVGTPVSKMGDFPPHTLRTWPRCAPSCVRRLECGTNPPSSKPQASESHSDRGPEAEVWGLIIHGFFYTFTDKKTPPVIPPCYRYLKGNLMLIAKKQTTLEYLYSIKRDGQLSRKHFNCESLGKYD